MQALRRVVHEDGVHAMCHEVGLNVLEKMMEEDARRECGVERKGQHSTERTGRRNGYEVGSVVVGGRRVPVLRPRVVGSDGKERPIDSYQAARNPEFLDRAALTACVLGVSQRNHADLLTGVAPLVDATVASCISKSAVGRRFVAAADRKVKEFLARRLGERYLVVWLDGVGEGGYLAIAAVGLTDTGEKRVLGLRQGSTEDATLCREFLEDLRARGLSAKHGILFVVDGGKGIARAIREVFGKEALVQRCRVHKKRNVLSKLTLPEGERDAVERKLEDAWKSDSDALARANLELLARGLEAQGQRQAAASLREGMRETITCNRLGIPVKLYATLTNTNVIESSFSQHEAIAHRVKRWRNGQQLLRWAGVALSRAEEGFGMVGDAELLRQLREALERHAAQARAESAKVATAKTTPPVLPHISSPTAEDQQLAMAS